VRLPLVRSVRSLRGAPAAVTARGGGLVERARLASAGARVAIGDVDVEAAESAARVIGADAFAFGLDATDPRRSAGVSPRSGDGIAPSKRRAAPPCRFGRPCAISRRSRGFERGAINDAIDLKAEFCKFCGDTCACAHAPQAASLCRFASHRS
jgi:hypothetical protein